MDSERPKNLYQRAGIDDLAEFYRVRYTSPELLNAEYFDAINRFDIRWSRTLWIYDNVRRGSVVLDLGCGSGVLALLKRKQVTLAGVDLASECAKVAQRNGYDFACAADLTSLPFPDSTFDYVVSLDVMGHIEFETKDAVIAEMKRVLKPDGVTMHGIECLNRAKRKGYEQMTEEELRQFIAVDGHVGMEPGAEVVKRFSQFFSRVRAEPRYSICQSAEELVKQADEYGTELCDTDLLDYLRGLSFDERRAFNMAMGYVFQRVSDLEVKLPPGEYAFLKASDQAGKSFYNEHRDRSDLVASELPGTAAEIAAPQPRFEAGWYAAELLPPVARWMGKIGRIRFRANSVRKISADVVSHFPDISHRPLQVEFLLNGLTIHRTEISSNTWQKVEISIDDVGQANGEFLLELRTDRTWQPRSTDPASSDTRELSLAVCNLQIET